MQSVDTTLHFPLSGVDVSTAFDRQRIGSVEGVYSYSTPDAVNVRSIEPNTNRARGGSRPGLKKYVAARPMGVRWVVQDLNVIVIASAEAQT